MNERCSLKQIAKGLVLSAMDYWWVDYLADHSQPSTLKPLDTFILTVSQFRSDFELKFERISVKYNNTTFSREQFISFLVPRCKMILDVSKKCEYFGLIMSCSFVTEMVRDFRGTFHCLQFDSAAYEFLSEFLESRFKALEDETFWNGLLNYCREINKKIIDCRRNVVEESKTETAAKSRCHRLVRISSEREDVIGVGDICSNDSNGAFCEGFFPDNEGSEQSKTRDNSNDDDEMSEEFDEHAAVRSKHFDIFMPDPEFKSEVFELLRICETGSNCVSLEKSGNEVISVQMNKDNSKLVCEDNDGNFRSEIIVGEGFTDSREKVLTSGDKQSLKSSGKIKNHIDESEAERDRSANLHSGHCRECKGKDFNRHLRKWKTTFQKIYKNLDKVSDLFNVNESNENVICNV